MTTRSRWRAVAALACLAEAFAWAAPTAAAVEANPTFARDIAPIFQAKCESCHRPDSVAPMSLTTYEETRPWVRSIRTQVEARQMPPWHMDKSVGIQDFKNDRSLTDDQIATIVRWIAQGAPRGNVKDLPPPIEWPTEQGWRFAKQFGQAEPDLVIRSTPRIQKAGADSVWWKPVVDSGLTEPRWVRAIEMRPSTEKARRITHHALAQLLQDETDPLAQNPVGPQGQPQAGLFAEWTVGSTPGETMRPNSGRLMLPGARFAWDIHYASSNEDITAQAEMGIYFYPRGQKPKFREMLHVMGATSGVDIPPLVVTQTEGFFVMKENGRIESLQALMHLRGRALSLEAILPNGEAHVLNYVSSYDFNWRTTFQYADQAAPLLPKGTVLKVVAWHDNTSANRANPDPNVWVGQGSRAVDEMAHAWVNITYMGDADYRAALAARRGALAKRANGHE